MIFFEFEGFGFVKFFLRRFLNAKLAKVIYHYWKHFKFARVLESLADLGDYGDFFERRVRKGYLSLLKIFISSQRYFDRLSINFTLSKGFGISREFGRLYRFSIWCKEIWKCLFCLSFWKYRLFGWISKIVGKRGFLRSCVRDGSGNPFCLCWKPLFLTSAWKTKRLQPFDHAQDKLPARPERCTIVQLFYDTS